MIRPVMIYTPERTSEPKQSCVATACYRSLFTSSQIQRESDDKRFENLQPK